MNDKRLQYPTGFPGRLWKNIVSLVVLFCLISLIPGALWAATYYVDATLGNDGNPGTEISPWKSLNEVESRSFASGDQVLFKRGEVWSNQNLSIPSDGITIGAYGSGDLPIFDGTTTVSWTMSGGMYSAAWVDSDPGMILYKGIPKPPVFTLKFSSDVSAVQVGAVLIQKTGAYCSFWVTSVDAATRQVSGITFFRDPAKHWVVGTANTIQLRQVVNGHEVKSDLTLSAGLDVYLQSLKKPGDWYWDADKLYLNSDSDPNAIVRVSSKVNGITANYRKNLTIQDIAVQGFQDTGVLIRKTVDSTVQRMQISKTGATVRKSGIILDHSSNNKILNNQIESVLRVGISLYAGDTSTDFSKGNTISGNSIKDSGSSGVSLGTGDPGTASTVADNTITGNTILNSNTWAWDSGGVYALFVGTNTISNNNIFDGGSQYLRSSGILIDWGVAPTTITGNVIAGNSFAGIAVTGRGHTITSNRLTNNGLASSENAQVVFFPVNENVTGCTVQRNSMVAESGKYLFLRVINPSWSQGTNTINYNTYQSRTAATFCWSSDWSCDGWVNFASWQNTTGHDVNSTFSFITDPPPPDIKSINSTYLLLLK